MEDILKLPVRRKDEAVPWKLWSKPGGPAGGRPFIAVMAPFDGEPHEAGNGQMLALMVERRAIVDEAHAYALANGASDVADPRCARNIIRTITARTSAIRTATRSASCATSRRTAEAGAFRCSTNLW